LVVYFYDYNQGILTEEGRLSMIDLLSKVACSEINVNIFFLFKKEQI